MARYFPASRGRIGPLVLTALLTALMTACAVAPTPPKPDARAAAPLSEIEVEYRDMRNAQGGQLQALDPDRSQVRILVFRGGRLPQVGHNHVLSAPKLQGRLWTPARGLAGARFALAFRLDELSVDPPELRAGLGPAWGSELTPEDVAGTREHMLGPDGLQAEAYPWVRLRSLQLVGEAPHLAAEVEIELHGQRRSQWLALQVQPREAGWEARGSLVLRQSDFGLKPYAVLGGLLAVRDELVIDFTLHTRELR
jgi:hypothetical protein